MRSSLIRFVSVGDEDALVALDARADLVQQVVDLAVHGPHLDLGVEDARRADDLLDDDALTLLQLVVGGRGGDEHDVVVERLELLERERSVVERTRQAEAVLDEVELAGAVAVVHPAHLGGS